MAPKQDDLTGDDHRVERTNNGPRDDDPDEQPPQDATWLPDGTATDTVTLTEAPE